MKTKIMLLLGVVILLFIVISFYWFELRPGLIRKDCEAYAGSKSSSRIRINNLYRQCLIRNGLPPESIFVNLQ